jgi:DNA-binding PadR family transcriptional regulator
MKNLGNAKRRERPTERDPSGIIGRNLEPFLLLELLRASSYGYELIRHLADYGFRRTIREPGVVYKVLRSLEDGGAIRSRWSAPESGPARRYYEITDAGRDLLRTRTYYLKRHHDRVERLLAGYLAMTGDDLAEDSIPNMRRKSAAGADHRRED